MAETDQYGRQIFKLQLKQTSKPQPLHQKPAKVVERKPLEASGAERELDPRKLIGTSFKIDKESKEAQPQSAFYCDACKCGLKDSQAWFDHINGKKHNRVKGMSMVVEQVDVQRVREKLQSLKKGVLGKRLHQETQ